MKWTQKSNASKEQMYTKIECRQKLKLNKNQIEKFKCGRIFIGFSSIQIIEKRNQSSKQKYFLKVNLESKLSEQFQACICLHQLKIATR